MCCHPSYLTISYAVSLLYAGGSGVGLYDGVDLKLFILAGLGQSFLPVAWSYGVQLVFFFCSSFSDVVWHPGMSIARQLIVSVNPRLRFIMVVIIIYLFDDALTS